MRWLVIGSVVIAVAGCGSAAARVSAPVSVVRCGPASARTLVGGRSARVYAAGQVVYGCMSGSRRRVRLGTLGPCLGKGVLGPAAVAGRVAAFAVRRCGVDTGTVTVSVVRLSDGRQLQFDGVVADPVAPELFARVEAIAVTPGGRVAWVANWFSILGHRSATQVLAAAPGRPVRVLDRGRGIVAASLAMRGGRVSWRDGHARRSARL